MGVNVRIILPLDKDGYVWGLGHHLRRNTIIIPGHTSGFGWFSNSTDCAHGTKPPPSAPKVNVGLVVLIANIKVSCWWLVSYLLMSTTQYCDILIGRCTNN
jgi:hypothetical protein